MCCVGKKWMVEEKRMSDCSSYVICFDRAVIICVFLFKQKTAYELRISDWSSDVCSSDRGCGGRGALHHPGGDHHCKTASQGGCNAEQHIAGDARQQNAPPSEAVGKRTPEELCCAQAKHIGGDDPLPIVLVNNIQRVAHGGQGRKHGVDRKRIERHQGCDQRNKLLETDREGGCCGAGKGAVHGLVRKCC